MSPDPASAHNAVFRARQAMQLGDRQAARDWAWQAVALDPDSDEPWLYLAALACPRASIHYFEQALRINPDSQPARKGMQWAEARLKREQPVPSPKNDPSLISEQADPSLEDTQPVHKQAESSATEDTQPVRKLSDPRDE